MAEIPQLNLVNSVPAGGVNVNPSVLAAPGRAMQQTAQAIGKVGDTVQDFALKFGQAKDEEGMSRLRTMQRQLESDMSVFVASNPDQEKWQPELEKRLATMEEEAGGLNFTNAGRERATQRMSEWSAARAGALAVQATQTQIQRGKIQLMGELEEGVKFRDRGRVEAAGEGLRAILLPEQVDELMREAETSIQKEEYLAEIEEDPRGKLEDLEGGKLPEWMDPITGREMKRRAEAANEDARRDEIELMELAADMGTLKPQDIEAAEFLTEIDKKKYAAALEKFEEPSAEDRAAAWDLLGTLRSARNDAGISSEQYQELHNTARTSINARIGMNASVRADLNKELNYLSPAGRQPGGGGAGGGDGRFAPEDLEAVGRAAVKRAREIGSFGDLAEYSELSAKDREAAFRRAEDVEIEVKNFIRSYKGDDLTPVKVRAFVDDLVAGSFVDQAAVPILRGVIPGVSVGESPGVLPPRDDLDSFLDQ